MTCAILVAGAWIRPTILARSSSSDGKAASALTPFGSSTVLPIAPPRITNFSWRLGEIDGDLGRANRIVGIGDHGRPLQQGADAGNVRAFKSDLGEAVLGDLHRCASLPGLLAQDLHLGNREAGIVSDDDGVGGLEDPLQLRHLLGFCRSFHKLSPVGGSASPWNIEPPVATCRPYPTRRAAAGTTIGALPLARITPLQVQRFEPIRSDCSDQYRPHPSVQAVD